MLQRSKDSKDAALLLLSKTCYDGSVVAFYYSVLQRMMYALNEDEKRPLTYEHQNPLNEDIHNRILTEIRNRFTISKEENTFKENFEKLSDYRKKADYGSESITQSECLECRSLFERLEGQLNRFFPIRV